MDRRHLVAGALAAVLVGSLAAATLPSGPQDPLGSERTYPEGAGPDGIDFAAIGGDADLTHAPRDHWDSYAIRYSAPPERRLVEGQYYVDSTTGEILAERWHDAEVYRNGTTYAFVQPAGSLPEHRREQFASDPQFVHDDATDAYYRYDPDYGRLAPTNIGRHTAMLDAYTWVADDATTHHGVAVITYRVTGTRTDAQAPPPVEGTLRLGAEDGLVYAYDLAVDADGDTYRYAYSVEPAPFPEHEWAETARTLADDDGSGPDGSGG